MSLHTDRSLSSSIYDDTSENMINTPSNNEINSGTASTNLPDKKESGENGNLRANNQSGKWAEKVYAFPDVVTDVSENALDDTAKKKDEKETEEKEPPIIPVSFTQLFQYSSCLDKILILFGVLSSLACGASMPLIIIFLGDMLESFVGLENTITGGHCGNATNASFTTLAPGSTMSSLELDTTTIDPNIFRDKFLAECATFAANMSIVGAACFVLNYITVFTLCWAAENQTLKIRQKFLQAVLRQDIGWYDVNETGDFASRITADLQKIQDGIGDKVGICVYFYSTTIICIAVSFYYGWKLTLVILAAMPVMIISTSIIAMIQSKVAGDELSAYGKAGAVAEEVLSSIRTVVSFGGENKEIIRYEKELIIAKKNGIKRGLLTSIGMATFWFCIYASYSLAFWYGTQLIIDSRCGDQEYTSGKMIVIFFCVLTGAMFIGQTAPYMEAFNTARGAARKVYDIIARVPPIDSHSELGERPRGLSGMVKIVDVHFRYPARPDVQVLQGLSLEAVPGETVALVGSSGCGKSTVIQLLQRFYDVEQGQIFIDGTDIKNLNLGWYRDKIGVVGQEPVLFNTSIAENIRYGYKAATDNDITAAAKAANAHDFISKLPQGYNTQVGQRGTQLSGGQKQRIAIARALIRNPKILLLDEATSALDTESESVVQAALDEARKGRTTIVVAHRLTTIRNANKIVAVDKGVAVEQGTHDELMEKKGIYFNLVMAQAIQQEKKPENLLANLEEKEEGDEAENDLVKSTESIGTMDTPVRALNRGISSKSQRRVDRQVSVTSVRSAGSDGTAGSMSNVWRRQSSVKRDDEKGLMQSTDSNEIDEDELDPEEKKGPDTWRLVKLTAPEWPYTLMGSFGSLLIGFSIPIYGILLGDILGSMNQDDETAVKETNLYCIVFLIMGVLSGLVVFIQTFAFTVAGECLTLRLRKMIFTMMVTQEMGWFDLPGNSTGALCSRLSADAAQVQGATGSRLSTIIQSLATLAAAIGIAVFYNWKIGLLVLGFIPFVLVSVYFESRVISGSLLNEKKAFENATKVAVEAIENIRTVASLHLENTFYESYANSLAEPHKMARKKAYFRGLTFGLAQCIPSLTYGASMYYGSTLISKGELTYSDLFKVVEGIIVGSMIIGQAVAFAPDAQKAKVSAVRIFRLLEKVSEINPFSKHGIKPSSCEGEVDFNDVAFTYPTRPTIKVLRGLNLSARQGETIALVGASGCGKSTCIQLLQRFYDPDQGNVLVEKHSTKSLELGWLRAQSGLVSQEPVLFGYSIKENIAYGDNSREVPMDEIIEAARKANIHNFVQSLPAQYETSVGDRGTQLSGGQKQRIAIARALIRKPKILLLDEATSALDSESEQVVQEALDNASEGRTCIVIAHRLSTIQNADQILVIHKGKVVEKGTHGELMRKEGFYFKLQSVQGSKDEASNKMAS